MTEKAVRELNALPQTAPAAPLLAAHPSVPLLDHDLVPGAARVAEWGPACLGDLLLLHGFGGDKTQLRPLADRLCPVGSTALLPTLRAHPGSPKPDWGYSPLDFAADVHRVADALPGPMHAVGYSYGALVAALSAVTWGGGRIRSLVLVDQSFAPHPELFEADEWVEASHLRWHYDYGHLPYALRAIGIPVLVLVARGSDMVGVAERALLEACGGQVGWAEIPGDHAGCLDDPGAIAAAVARFHREHA